MVCLLLLFLAAVHPPSVLFPGHRGFVQEVQHLRLRVAQFDSICKPCHQRLIHGEHFLYVKIGLGIGLSGDKWLRHRWFWGGPMLELQTD